MAALVQDGAKIYVHLYCGFIGTANRTFSAQMRLITIERVVHSVLCVCTLAYDEDESASSRTAAETVV